MPYHHPSRMRDHIGYEDLSTDPRPPKEAQIPDPASVEEVCVILTNIEASVRGFLALARREAEAGWSARKIS